VYGPTRISARHGNWNAILSWITFQLPPPLFSPSPSTLSPPGNLTQTQNGVLIVPLVFSHRSKPSQNHHFPSILSKTAQAPAIAGICYPAAVHGHRGRSLRCYRRDHGRGGERGVRGCAGGGAVADGPRAAAADASGGGGRRRQGGGEAVLQQLRVRAVEENIRRHGRGEPGSARHSVGTLEDRGEHAKHVEGRRVASGCYGLRRWVWDRFALDSSRERGRRRVRQ